MVLKELQKKLKENNISEDLYSLNGGLPNEKYCIEKIKEEWKVYYSERGIKSNIKTFVKEDDACEYFYHNIIQIFT